VELGRAGEGGPELLLILPAHPLQEVQPLSTERSHTGHGGAGQDSVGQQRGTGQRMGTTAGGTDRVATIRAKAGKNRGGVGGAVGDGPIRPAGGAAIAGPRVGDIPESSRRHRLGERWVLGPLPRRPVVDNQRDRTIGAGDLNLQEPPVRQRERERGQVHAAAFDRLFKGRPAHPKTRSTSGP
jgi:hypothetical protein